jgi:hypothetical protein
MMKRTTALALALTMLLTLLVLAPSVCSAADKPSNITVKVDIVNPGLFWSYPYINKDSGKVSKAAAVQAVWSTTNGTKTSRADVVLAGKNYGAYKITAEKGVLLDLEVQVVDAGKNVLNKGGIQIRSDGQTVSFVVAPPEGTAPLIDLQQ